MNDWWALPRILDGRCTLCGLCVLACRKGALALGTEMAWLHRPQVCDCCGLCEDVCAEGAIECTFEITLGSE